ncbi:MAG: hypothetical protein HONDAALG_02583 [Gammaproteobacteria bacterium]|nr:hypothetical protein [Gammaproteobacteria bacterium]
MEPQCIPIILITKNQSEVSLQAEAEVLAYISVDEVINRKGQISSPADIVVVDLTAGAKQNLVICSLLLRNAGRSVVICDIEVFPIQIIRDLHKFYLDAKATNKKVKTEVLLTEEAMESLGDISEDIDFFEKNYLAKSTQSEQT